jgi:hypothetical protein
MRKSTVMPRLMSCKVCGYTQEDYTSYYKHSKAWAKGHDLNACWELRRSQKSFDEMFSESLTSISNLTINK